MARTAHELPPAKLIGVAVRLPKHPVERDVVVVRAEENAVAVPQGLPDEGDLVLDARLLDNDVAVALGHEARESLKLGGAAKGSFEPPPLHLQTGEQQQQKTCSFVALLPVCMRPALPGLFVR